MREPPLTSYYVYILHIKDVKNKKKNKEKESMISMIKPSEHKIIFSIDGFCIMVSLSLVSCCNHGFYGLHILWYNKDENVHRSARVRERKIGNKGQRKRQK